MWRRKKIFEPEERKTYAGLEALASSGPRRDDHDRLDAPRDGLARVGVAVEADLRDFGWSCRDKEKERRRREFHLVALGRCNDLEFA